MKARVIIALIAVATGSLCAQGILLPVKMDAKWGYINKQKEVKIPFRFDWASDFQSSGYAVVQLGDRFGIIDSGGREAVLTRFKFISHIDSCYFRGFEDGQWKLLNATTGTEIALCSRQLIHVGGGSFVIRCGTRCGLIDPSGKEQIPFLYDTIRTYSSNVFLVKKGRSYGLYLRDKMLCDTVLDERPVRVRFSSDSLLYVKKKNGKWGLVDTYGAGLAPGEWDRKSSPKSSYILFEGDKGKDIFSCKSRTFIELPKDVATVRPFASDLLLFVKNDSTRGLMNLEGKKILDGGWDDVYNLQDGISVIYREDKAGLFFWGSRKTIEPFFDDIGKFNSNGVAIFQNEVMEGLINLEGEIIAKAEYDAIVDSETSFKLYKDEGSLRVVHVNSKGRVTDSEFYKDVTSIQINGSFRSALRQERDSVNSYGWFQNEKGKYGMNDSDGKRVIPNMFDAVELHPELGLSLASMNIGTARNVQRRYFLVDHIKRKIVLRNYVWINMPDFSPVDTAVMAHAILENQSHTLVSRSGRKLNWKINFVGDFREGSAPICTGGITTCVRGFGRGFLVEKPFFVRNFLLNNASGRFNLRVLGGKWGFVDRYGNIKIEPQYELALNFSEGKSIVRQNGKYGVIDSTASGYVIEPVYDSISRMEGSDEKMFRLEMKKCRWGFVNYKGEFMTDMLYDQARDFKNGCAAVSKGGKWTFIDSTGKEICGFIFDKVRDFSEGLAAVRVKGKWGYIDTKAVVQVGHLYAEAGDFCEGKTWARKNGKCGFIDGSGKEVVPFIFASCRSFRNGMAIVRHPSRYGAIDNTGKLVIPAKYSYLGDFNAFGTVSAFLNGKAMVLDSEGKKISGKKFDRIEDFSEEGLAAFRKKNHWGYLDHKGDVVIREQFTEAGKFQNGIALVGGVGEMYFIGMDGNPLNEKDYIRAGSFKNGIAHVRSKQGESFIDTTGKLLFSPLRAQIVQDFGDSILLAGKRFYRNVSFLFSDGSPLSGTSYSSALPFFKGYAFVKRSRWGIINKAGLPVIDERFDATGKLKEGKMRVQIRRIYGAATLDGKLITEANYEKVKYCSAGIIRLEWGDHVGYLSVENEWVYKPSK